MDPSWAYEMENANQVYQLYPTSYFQLYQLYQYTASMAINGKSCGKYQKSSSKASTSYTYQLYLAWSPWFIIVHPISDKL